MVLELDRSFCFFLFFLNKLRFAIFIDKSVIANDKIEIEHHYRHGPWSYWAQPSTDLAKCQ
jgi:hypothetical protein